MESYFSIITGFLITFFNLLFGLIKHFKEKNIEMTKINMEIKKAETDNIYKNNYNIYMNLIDDFTKFQFEQTEENKQKLINSILKSYIISSFRKAFLKEVVELLHKNKIKDACDKFIENISSISANMYSIQDDMKVKKNEK